MKAVPTRTARLLVVLVVVPRLAELVVVVPDGGGVGEVVVDARGRDVERVERVADHREVA